MGTPDIEASFMLSDYAPTKMAKMFADLFYKNEPDARQLPKDTVIVMRNLRLAVRSVTTGLTRAGSFKN